MNLFTNTGPRLEPNRPNWRERAACKEADDFVFFPPGRPKETSRLWDEAKEICARCPVAELCLKSAIDNNEEWGMWGGLTADQIRRMKRRNRTPKPATPAGQPTTPRRRVYVEDVEFMVRHGAGWQEITRRIGVTRGAVEKTLYAAGRNDLASRISAQSVTEVAS